MDKKGHRKNVSVIPDLVLPILFNDSDYGVFFVEMDRSTMRGKMWDEKVSIYRAAIKAGLLKSRYKTHWGIVLTVTTGERRLKTLLEKTAAVGGRRGFWFTTMDELKTQGVFGKIWQRSNEVVKSRAEERPPGMAPIKWSILDSIGDRRGDE